MTFTCIPGQIALNKSPLRKRLLSLLLWEISHLPSPSRSCLGRRILIHGAHRGLVGGAAPGMILTTERGVCLKLSEVKGQLCHFPRTSRAEMGSYVHDASSLHKHLSTEFHQHLYAISVSAQYCPGLITNSSQTHSSETTLWTAPGVRQSPLLSKLQSWVESQADIKTPPNPPHCTSF